MNNLIGNNITSIVPEHEEISTHGIIEIISVLGGSRVIYTDGTELNIDTSTSEGRLTLRQLQQGQ